MSKLKSIIILTITGALLTIGFVGATSESGSKIDADEPITNEQSKIAVKQNELKEKEVPVKTENVKENLNEDKVKPQKDETKTETKIESKQEPEIDKEQEIKQEPESKQEEQTKPEPKVEKKPEPKPEPKKSNAEIVKEVLAGKWGTGEERNRRLTNAGYDANSIQNEVNKSAPKPAPKPSQPIESKQEPEIDKEQEIKQEPESKQEEQTKPSEPSTSQPETKPVSYPANSVTVGNHSITWVYWENVTGSAWWEGSESAATGVQNAVDKEANHWVNVMTQDNLFSINGSNNLWVAAHNYNSPGKQIYHIPEEVIITDSHGVSATYTYIDRAKTYNYIGTGTYGSNDVFIQTSRPDGVNILHYRLSKRLN